jgi:Na+/phosphate symporter
MHNIAAAGEGRSRGSISGTEPYTVSVRSHAVHLLQQYNNVTKHVKWKINNRHFQSSTDSSAFQEESWHGLQALLQSMAWSLQSAQQAQPAIKPELNQMSRTLVEKSSKPAAPINYHWQFQLSRVSRKNKVGPAWEPPVETYFHWRLS